MKNLIYEKFVKYVITRYKTFYRFIIMNHYVQTAIEFIYLSSLLIAWGFVCWVFFTRLIRIE